MITFAPFPEIPRRKRPHRPHLLLVALFLALVAVSGLVVLCILHP